MRVAPPWQARGLAGSNRLPLRPAAVDHRSSRSSWIGPSSPVPTLGSVQTRRSWRPATCPDRAPPGVLSGVMSRPGSRPNRSRPVANRPFQVKELPGKSGGSLVHAAWRMLLSLGIRAGWSAGPQERPGSDQGGKTFVWGRIVAVLGSAGPNRRGAQRGLDRAWSACRHWFGGVSRHQASGWQGRRASPRPQSASSSARADTGRADQRGSVSSPDSRQSRF